MVKVANTAASTPSNKVSQVGPNVKDLEKVRRQMATPSPGRGDVLIPYQTCLPHILPRRMVCILSKSSMIATNDSADNKPPSSIHGISGFMLLSKRSLPLVFGIFILIAPKVHAHVPSTIRCHLFFLFFTWVEVHFLLQYTLVLSIPVLVTSKSLCYNEKNVFHS